jgi:hypothetical protein
MRIELFEKFEEKIKKRKKKTVRGETDSYPPPEYVVQPAKDDKGFFMFKKAFDSMKKKFDTGFFSV